MEIDKRGVVWDTLIPWIIGIGVLVLGFIIFAVLKGKGEGFIGYIGDLFRFGR